MRPSVPLQLGTVLALLLAGGCTSLLGGGGEVPRVRASERDTQVAVVLAGTIQSLQRLATASPAEQSEIVAAARLAYERSPGGAAQMRYALTLATPGHAGRDAERALTLTQLAQLDRELGLKVDNDRLQTQASSDQERLAAANRRMQQELDDNARLRRQLAEAQAKLDAIANIEPNLIDRKATTEVHKK